MRDIGEIRQVTIDSTTEALVLISLLVGTVFVTMGIQLAYIKHLMKKPPVKRKPSKRKSAKKHNEACVRIVNAIDEWWASDYEIGHHLPSDALLFPDNDTILITVRKAIDMKPEKKQP